MPLVTIGDAPDAEEGSPVLFPLTIDKRGAHDRPITVHWEAIVDRTTPGKASENDLPRMTGSFLIASGTTTTNLPVPTADDEAFEDDEELGVRITEVENAGVGTTSQGTGTITSEDPAPVLTWWVEKTTMEEGEETTIHLELDRKAEGGAVVRIAPAQGSEDRLSLSESPTQISFATSIIQVDATKDERSLFSRERRGTNGPRTGQIEVIRYVACGRQPCSIPFETDRAKPDPITITIVDNGAEPPAATKPGLTVESGDGWAELAWTAPAEAPSSASATITHYEYRLGKYTTKSGRGPWVAIPDSDDAGTSQADERALRLALPNNRGEKIELRAVDAEGAGAIASANARPAAWLPLPANALVSNIRAGTKNGLASNTIEQRFTTGGNSAGYTIEGVDFYPHAAGHGVSSLAVKLCKVGDEGTCADLTAAHGAKTDRYAYNTSSEYVAEANAEYEIRITSSAGRVRMLGSFSQT